VRDGGESGAALFHLRPVVEGRYVGLDVVAEPLLCLEVLVGGRDLQAEGGSPGDVLRENEGCQDCTGSIKTRRLSFR